jgi:hypothetical protein
MSSNYHWQQHQVNEQIQNRMREGELHRMAKRNSPSRPSILFRAIKWVFSKIGSASAEQKPVSRKAKKVQKPGLAR